MPHEPLEPRPEKPLEAEAEMPVVARMVIEVRSDGTRTMARGALEDLVTGQQVGIETQALNPIELSAALTRALLATPGLAREALKAAIPGRLRRLKNRLLRRDEPT